MKKLLFEIGVTIAYIAVGAAVFYIECAFISWSWQPTDWPTWMRAIFALATIFLIIANILLSCHRYDD